MATRISQPPVAGSSSSDLTTASKVAQSVLPGTSFTVKGTFAPKEVWGVFTPLKWLQFDGGDQFSALLRTGQTLRGQFQFNEMPGCESLELTGALGRKLLFDVIDMTLGTQNELLSVKLLDPASKEPAFSLFAKR